MKQFSFERHSYGGVSECRALGSQVDVEWELIDNDYEKSWVVFATRIIDALELWCKASGITKYGMGHTQIAIQVTFAELKDAMLFKLRWHLT